ncbi:hypothetical protein ABT072_30665 [Streptomyces sp. NPDC002589]|uniref:hypothetical protein n=1 Tax=Streptomyces sp. NPDC002589 TaxID=3154420 RepID=UPI00332B6CED
MSLRGVDRQNRSRVCWCGRPDGFVAFRHAAAAPDATELLTDSVRRILGRECARDHGGSGARDAVDDEERA